MSSEGTSISETIASLEAPPPVEREEQAAPAQDETEITEAVPTAEDATGPEEATEGDASEAEGDTEAEEAVQTPLDPPLFWDAEDKEAFGTLTRAEQERLLKYSKVSDKAAAAKIDAAAIAQRAAAAEASKFSQYMAGLDKLASQVQEAFKSKWPDDIDWIAVANQQGADEAFKLKTQYEEDKKLSDKLQTAKVEAERVNTERFRAERSLQFKTVIPELADEKLGPQRQLDLVKYLSEHAEVSQDIIINRASAKELSIGYKAMLWDKAQSKAASLINKPNPPPPPSKTSVRATAPADRGNPQTAKVKAADAAFRRDPSVKNLVALEEAKGN